MDTQTFVGVRWQDGTMTKGMRATDLVPVQHVLHADFWPEDFVIAKGEGAHDRLGVVKRVIADARTCDVMWLPKEKDSQEEMGDTASKEPETEEVSMYAIDSHPDFSYRLGCIVLRLNKDSSTPSTAEEAAAHVDTTTTVPETSSTHSPANNLTTTTAITPTPGVHETSHSDQESGYEGEAEAEAEAEEVEQDEFTENADNNNNNSQEMNKGIGAWVGQIVNIHNGIITVCWADGSTSAARPEELFKINDDDYESESSEYDDEYPILFSPY
jgi:hypothetical protein